jgi:hypothetical protein
MVLHVGIAILIALIGGTGGSAYYHYQQHNSSINYFQLGLAFFLTMNTLVCIWEIGLGLFIKDIKKYYELTLLKKHPNRSEHLAATLGMFFQKPSLGELLSLKFWAERIWGTYSLYDPSYSNHESFGFFIDVGNGWSTLLISVYLLVGMTNTIWTDIIDPLWFGMIGLIFFYQMLYGTVIYFVQFMYHRRYAGRTFFEVALFVGLSNGLWFAFPFMGMYCSAMMIRSNSFDIVRKNHF